MESLNQKLNTLTSSLELLTKSLIDQVEGFNFSNSWVDQWEYLQSQMEVFNFKKGQLINEPGSSATCFYYIGHGYLKRYWIDSDGAPCILSFDGPNSLVSDFQSLLSSSPSNLWIEAITDGFGLKSPENLHLTLRQRHPLWEQVGRRITELRYLELNERVYNHLSLSPKQRYNRFLKDHLKIAPFISQQDIASYLGVSKSTISRLGRAK